MFPVIVFLSSFQKSKPNPPPIKIQRTFNIVPKPFITSLPVLSYTNYEKKKTHFTEFTYIRFVQQSNLVRHDKLRLPEYLL